VRNTVILQEQKPINSKKKQFCVEKREELVFIPALIDRKKSLITHKRGFYHSLFILRGCTVHLWLKLGKG